MKDDIFLKPGDTVGICAPSACFNLAEFEAGLQVFQNMGYKIHIPKHIFSRKRYLAGSDTMRADTINTLFENSDISGVICARGGYGALRLLDHLDWDVINKNFKLFIGFSDITSVLLSILDHGSYTSGFNRDSRKKISAQFKKIVIHGPTIVSLAKAHNKTIESLSNTMQGVFSNINIADGEILKSGKCSGFLTGGNISTISHLMGTNFQPDFNNAVLFLEDTGEPAYKIDRMLTQMKMAGMFQNVRGVMTGSFQKCDNDQYISEILLDIFSRYHIPVVTGIQAGHGKINLSLPMGMDIKMDIGPDIATSTISWI